VIVLTYETFNHLPPEDYAPTVVHVNARNKPVKAK
jgi:aspartate 1-decarboxylase